MLNFSVKEADILFEILKARRDVRGNRFLSKPISEEHLDKIFQAALHAPSVGFSQPWKFVSITEEAQKQKIFNIFIEENEKASELFKDTIYSDLKLEGIKEAPVNIAVYYSQKEKAILGQTSMDQVGEYSVVCAIQNMWLMARALNIGMGWVSILDSEKVNAVLKAPKDHKLIGYFCLGHVSEFLDSPELESLKWEKRKNKEEIIFKETF
jgi:5,6-dimethylbenzimidazole synthase